MSFKDAYYYLFYKFYKLFADGSADWLSDWKAELIIDVLFIFIGLSGVVYYTVISKEWIDFGDRKFAVFIYIGIVAVPNYLIFHHRDQWKGIVKKFDQLPRKKNIIGGVVVYSIVALVVFNLIIAFYLMSQIDWTQYR